MSEFKPLRSFEDRFTVKKTLEFGGCKLYAGVVRLNLDEKLLEASRVEFAREQAAAFVVAPNHLTDLTMLADEGHEVTALGNGDSEQAFGNGGQTQKPARRSMGATTMVRCALEKSIFMMLSPTPSSSSLRSSVVR